MPSASPAQRDELLEVYDAQLARSGAAVVARRRRYLARLAPRVAEAYERITRSGLLVTLAYQTARDVPDPELEAALAELLRQNRRRDLAAAYTTSGPHADDFELSLGGRPARLYASQGQLRALVLSLKVAEIQELQDTLAARGVHTGTAEPDAPILLLDDVSSELDPARNAFLFEFLRSLSCQVFITTTHPGNVHLGASGDRLDLHVHGGQIHAAAAPPPPAGA